MSKIQSDFVQDLAKLITFAFENGIELTVGEAYRTAEQQQIYMNTGKTKTLNSLHLVRQAMDFNFFIGGKLTYEKKDVEILGKFWEGLSPLNQWGGFWKFTDTPHFQKG